jgi:C1A family cysteine protease
MYGWKRDLPDHRDRFFLERVAVLPKAADLRSGMPAIYDQGNLGSCTANAVSAALDFDRHKQGKPFETPSRLFVYYNERKDDGDISTDAGASIRESIKAVTHYGACPETEWPYNIAKFTAKPAAKCYKDALLYEGLTYLSVTQSATALKSSLALGFPVCIGISVYESFESATVAKTGIVPLPAKSEQMLGGHAVLLCGYNDAKGVWVVRNSWGASWGGPLQGYCYMPYAYLTNPGLSSDFWTLRSVKA